MSCKVRTRRGILVWRLFFDGHESQEGTGLRDTPKNREKVELKAQRMSLAMKDGEFEYLEWFPNGNIAHRFRETPPPAVVPPKPIGEWAERTWLPGKVPPTVRATLAVTYRKHLANHILPLFADWRFAEVTFGILEDFRTVLVAPAGSQPFTAAAAPTDAPQDARDRFRRLLSGPAGRGKGLAMKTARDIIDGTFRALYRDARKDGIATGDPFAKDRVFY